MPCRGVREPAITAALQRATVDQHGGDRTLALVELGLDHCRLGIAIGVGLEFKQFGLDQDLLDQFVQTLAGLGRYLDVLHVTRHRLDDDLVLQQALAHLCGFASGLSDLLIATIIGTPAALV